MNDVLKLLAAHRTHRRFEEEPLADDLVRKAVQAAQCAATSSWVQGYSLLQVTRPNERARLGELCGDQAQVAGGGAFFVICADARRHALIAAREEKPFARNLETFLVAVVDASLFAQNLVVAFESLGLGTCYIGGLRTRLPEVSETLELPADVYPLFGLCVGRPIGDPGTRPRLPVEAVWMKDRYDSDAQALSRIEAHDATSVQYYRGRDQPGRSWSGGIWRKFQQPVREHLAGYYKGQGAILD